MKENDDLATYKLNKDPKQYLELWKWFTDDAAKRMITLLKLFFLIYLGLIVLVLFQEAP